MSKSILFVITVLLMSCSDPKPHSDTQNISPDQDFTFSPILTIDSNTAKDNLVPVTQRSGSQINCHDLLHTLINKSSYNPEIKKFGFGVWVDTVYNGIAIIQITVHNSERNDDPVIGNVKIDFNNKKLWDNSSDTAKELSYDTALLRELDKNCLMKEE